MQALPPPFPSGLANRLGTFLLAVGEFVVVAGLLYLPARYVVVPLARRTMDALGVDATWELPLLRVLRAGSAVVAVLAGANVAGFASFLQATELVVAASTIALGFAGQEVLGNFVSGVIIVTDPQYNIGDWIQWDGKEGIIEDISFRVTRVHTFDNELISVPNAELTANAVTNPAAKDTRRVRRTFCVSYDADFDLAKQIAVEAARDREDVLARPAPTAQLLALGDSCVELEARLWIDSPARTNFLRIQAAYTEDVVARFAAAGIEMPYPTRRITGSLDTGAGTGAGTGVGPGAGSGG
jgi:small-conductance mechanosensitive channel